MTPQKRILRKTTLDLLHGIGVVGMPRDLLAQYLEAETELALTDQALTDLLAELRQMDWVRTYENPLTKQVRWMITFAGEGARAALTTLQ